MLLKRELQMTKILSDAEIATRDAQNSKFAAEHSKRVAYRAAHNGQPNGYKPVTEAELQADKHLLDRNFGKFAA
jgi:hypothetical protein